MVVQIKKNNIKALIALILTLIIAIIYSFLGKIIPKGTFLAETIGNLWNLVFVGSVGYIFIPDRFKEQFKHFSIKIAIWGTLLTFFTGTLASSIYSLIGKATSNSIGSHISLQTVLLSVPLLLIGEEIVSTNVIISLENLGLKFGWASLICGILFALWHIPAYGFNPAQLLITLMPTRLVLNYIWKKSNSIWVSWVAHYLFDCIAFIQFFV